MAVQRPTEFHAPFHSDSSAEIEEEGEEEEEEEEAVVMDSPPDDDHCSICHDDFTLPCQANCSHWFCGSCILRVWHHGSALQPCKCPMCRRLITLIVPSQISRQENTGAETGQVMASIAQYNQLFGGGPRSLTQKLWDLPFFLRRLARDFTDPHRTLPFLFRARIVFAVRVFLVVGEGFISLVTDTWRKCQVEGLTTRKAASKLVALGKSFTAYRKAIPISTDKGENLHSVKLLGSEDWKMIEH